MPYVFRIIYMYSIGIALFPALVFIRKRNLRTVTAQIISRKAEYK